MINSLTIRSISNRLEEKSIGYRPSKGAEEMTYYKLAPSELKFAEIIWEQETIQSGELVKKCEEAFAWKKSTTYTVLKKLCEKGFFKNEKAIVTTLIKKEAYYQYQSEQFVEETFEGSLPKFIAAFMSRKKLSTKQVEAIQKMIDAYKED